MRYRILWLVLAAVLLGGCASMPSQQARDAYLQTSPGLPDDVRTAIHEGRVIVGMTAKQVYTTWGQPRRISRSVDAAGQFEQWVYMPWEHHMPWGRLIRYVHLRNGVVVSVTESRG